MLEAQLQHLQMIAELRMSTLEARRSMAPHAQPPGGQAQDKESHSDDSLSDEEGSRLGGAPSFTPVLATAHL